MEQSLALEEESNASSIASLVWVDVGHHPFWAWKLGLKIRNLSSVGSQFKKKLFISMIEKKLITTIRLVLV